jgi:transcriptional regulator with XRE-family HTH domain
LAVEKSKRVRRKTKAGAAFGKVLRDLRTAKGWTQEELAFETGLERTYVSLLERGRGQPTLAAILQISDGIGITASDLIGRVVNGLASTKRKD